MYVVARYITSPYPVQCSSAVVPFRIMRYDWLTYKIQKYEETRLRKCGVDLSGVSRGAFILTVLSPLTQLTRRNTKVQSAVLLSWFTNIRYSGTTCARNALITARCLKITSRWNGQEESRLWGKTVRPEPRPVVTAVSGRGDDWCAGAWYDSWCMLHL